jgi:hypothetical protein
VVRLALIWAVCAHTTYGAGGQGDRSKRKDSVDWARLVIASSGVGIPDLRAATVAVARVKAKRAARDDAAGKLSSTLAGIRVSSTETVGDRLASDAALKTKVDLLVKAFRIVDPQFYTDGGVDYDVELDLPPIEAALLTGPHPGPLPGGEGTGLVVDARALKLSRALAPLLVDESEKEVYGPDLVTMDALSKVGVVAYVPSLVAAIKLGRAGDHPLVLKALRTKDGVDVVLRSADADRVRGAAFLAEGRVAILAP